MVCSDESLREIAFEAGGRAELLKAIIDAVGVRSFVEVGVWKGELSEFILKNCESIQQYFMIDPWRHLQNWNKPFNVDSETFRNIMEEALKRVEFAQDRVVVLRGETSDVADMIPDGSLDFAYIDGDHTLRGITRDLMKLYPKVRQGGYIAGDDFVNNPWQHAVDYEPTLVCPYAVYFAEAMGLRMYALPFSQFLMIKSDKSDFKFIDFTDKFSDLSLKGLVAGK